MTNQKQMVKLLKNFLSIVSISKECSEKTKELLEAKLDEGLMHARHVLMVSKVIPTKLTFHENALYRLENRRSSY